MKLNRASAVPVTNPADDGVYYGIPILGSDINKLARRMVKINYLTDSRGKTIFNPKGQPIPQFDKDEDVVVAEAVKRCAKVMNVHEVLPDQTTTSFIDEGARKDLVESGACDAEEAARRIPAGTIVSQDLKKQIFEQFMEIETETEVEVPVNADDPDGPKKTQKKKQKAGMLVAEWFIDEMAKRGQTQRQEEQKNSSSTPSGS